MLRGMEEYEFSDFTDRNDIKGAILGVLDNELEVFDPLCDGPVEHAEGIAMARELVEKVFSEIEFTLQQREYEEEFCRE